MAIILQNMMSRLPLLSFQDEDFNKSRFGRRNNRSDEKRVMMRKEELQHAPLTPIFWLSSQQYSLQSVVLVVMQVF